MHDLATQRATQDGNKRRVTHFRHTLREILEANGKDRVKAVEQHRKARARGKPSKRANCNKCNKAFDAYHDQHERCAKCQLDHQVELKA